MTNFDDLIVKQGESHQRIDQFFGCVGSKEITLEDDAHLDYFLRGKECDITIVCRVSGAKSSLRLWTVFPCHHSALTCRLRVELSGNASMAEVHVVSLVGDAAELDVEAGIVMLAGATGMQGTLLEEQYLLGTPKKLRVLPLLDVHTPDVKASHGAKIEQLDSAGLFYMMAKGLPFARAQYLVLDGILQSIFARFSQYDEHLLYQYKQSLLSELTVNICS